MSEVSNGWTNIKFGELEVNDGFPALPEGDFDFQLLPVAQYRTKEFDGKTYQDVNASASFVAGDLQGRRIFFSYPDPTSTNKDGKPKTWSAQMLKKLSIVMGIDIEDGEDPVAYLNRAATTGAARFGGKLQKGRYIPEGQTEPRVELNLFSVRPAA
jgi:hypothetical protein